MQKFQLKAAHSLVAIGKRDGDRNQGRCEFLIIFRTYPRFTRRFALAKVSRREGRRLGSSLRQAAKRLR
ncbi:MAG: hypothetical protein RMX97_07730 [Nostoc sp. DedQUE11]|nr:hypothetical protein [Nostoc sp. DedQUE11]